MAQTLTLRDANQHFSRCIREVENGKEFVITRNGKPVARLVPAEGARKRVLTPEQEAALARIEATAASGVFSGLATDEPFDRDALHERS